MAGDSGYGDATEFRLGLTERGLVHVLQVDPTATAQDGPVSGDERVRDPGNDHAWLNETSDDGDTWSQEHHPVHGTRDSGGIERAVSPEMLAREVLARQFAMLRGDDRNDWEELYLRDHRAEPHAVEVRVPRQVRDAVWQTPTVS